MLFAVRMDVHLPPDIDPDARAELLAREKAYSQDLQRAGKWAHIWRIVGQYANLSVFDVTDGDELHGLLWRLPLFPYMRIEVTPLADHPSDIHADTAAVLGARGLDHGRAWYPARRGCLRGSISRR